jgi:high-affinity iron transporter
LLANFLIGLREGIEAALIVSILVTYLVKLGERKHIAKIFLGVEVAVAVAIGVGVALTELEGAVPAELEPAISGGVSVLAAVFVTWMIFWMAKQSRAMAGSLRGQIDQAVVKSGWSLALVAFLAVLREGVETSVLLWSSTKTTATDSSPMWGAVLGLAAATALGYLIYRGAVKLNLSAFFRITGGYLIVVAAGILAYAVGEFQEIGWLPFLTAHTYDVSAALPEASLFEIILKGTIAFNTAPTLLQSIAWFGFIIPTAWKFGVAQSSKAKAPVSVSAERPLVAATK